jgi:methylglutaconyl-CoA hydratase
VLSLNRPAAKNAISLQLLTDMQQHLTTLTTSPTPLRVVILASNVPNAFCAGADLKERATMTPHQVVTFLGLLRATFRQLEVLPVPTIAAIDGPALGGGLEMALCCDMRVVGQNAKVGLPETRLAIIPGAGGTQRLSRLIGIPRAKELIYTGRILSPQQAMDMHLANTLCEDAMVGALELARELLPQGPVAIRMAKLAIDRGSQMDMDNALEFEQACYAQVIPTQDRLEGLNAFREKRRPVYKGV